jgi:hypothetical protein
MVIGQVWTLRLHGNVTEWLSLLFSIKTDVTYYRHALTIKSIAPSVRQTLWSLRRRERLRSNPPLRVFSKPRPKDRRAHENRGGKEKKFQSRQQEYVWSVPDFWWWGLGVFCAARSVATKQNPVDNRSSERVRLRNKRALRVSTCTHAHSRVFLLGILLLLELLVGVAGCGPPLRKPIFYASSAMLTL